MEGILSLDIVATAEIILLFGLAAVMIVMMLFEP